MQQLVQAIGEAPSLLLTILLTFSLLAGCSESDETAHSPAVQIVSPLEDSRFKVGEEIRFEGSGSDPDGTIKSYQWNFDDQATASGQIVTHAYSESGEYGVTLAVTDNEGHMATTSLEITVLNSEQSRYERSFSKMRVLCEEAGGSFNEKTRECDCAATLDGHPRIFSALPDRTTGLQSGRCVELPVLRPEGADTFTELAENSPEDFKSQLTRFRYFQKRPYYFTLPHEIGELELKSLAEKLDRIGTVYVDIPPKFGFHDDMRILYGHIDLSLATLHYYLDPNFPDYENKYTDIMRLGISPMISKQSNSKTMKHILATGRNAPEMAWQFPDFTSSHPDYATLSGLKYASDRLSENLFQQNAGTGCIANERNEVIILDEGCHKRCITRKYFNVSNDDTHLYWYEKFYVNGGILRQALFTGSKDALTVDGMAFFGRGRQVSLILAQKRTLEGNRLKVEWSAYDDSLNELSNDGDEYVQYPVPDIETAGSNIAAINNPDGLIPIIILENGFDILYDQALLNRVPLGPYRSEAPEAGGSILGWVNGPGDETGTLLNAFTYFGEILNRNTLLSPENTSHSTRVRSIALDPGGNDCELGIIPLNNYYALYRYDVLDHISKNSNARVINLSALSHISQTACEENGATLHKNFLWIMAAGNAGLETPTFRCPQWLGPDHLKIVVAARDGDDLAAYSDYGTGYADIAADDDGAGTSFASPRVANVAAKIVAMHGDALANRHVRLAVLLGARVDVHNRIPVRTGGFLYEMGAFRAAQYIASLSETNKVLLVNDLPGNRADTKRELIQQTIRTSIESDPIDEDVKNQVNYLIDTGILKGIVRY